MRKAIIAALVLGLVAVCILIGHNFIKSLHQPPADALKAIPVESALVFHSTRSDLLWYGVSGTSVIWEELKNLEPVLQAGAILAGLDTVLYRNKAFKLQDRAVFMGFKSMEDGSVGWLLSTEVDEDEVRSVSALLNSFSTDTAAPVELDYSGVPYMYTSANEIHSGIYYFILDGVLGVSFSEALVKQSIRQISGGNSLRNDPDFLNAFATLGRNVSAHILVNYTNLEKMVSSLSEATSSWMQQRLSGWSALDFHYSGNEINLSGIVFHQDSANSFLEVLKDTPAPELTVMEVMPSSTAYFKAYGFSEFEEFINRYNHFLKSDSALFNLEARYAAESDTCACDYKKLSMAWVQNQAAFCTLEPKGGAKIGVHYLIYKAKDADDAVENMKLAHAAVSEEATTDSLNQDAIYKFSGSDIYTQIFSKSIPKAAFEYFCKIENYIVFGSSPETLKYLRHEYEKNRTLVKSEHFAAVSSQISDRSNMLIYSSPARSTEIYKSNVNVLHEGVISEHTTLLKKFQSFVFQLDYYKENKFYNHVYLLYNPELKSSPESLWEVDIKGLRPDRVQLVRNHYTEAQEVFAQDSSNTIYLISTTGKILWQKQIDGPVLGSVHQIDIYKNGKLQLLFNTTKSIYLFDRNGEPVEKFPVTLSEQATAPLSVADYDSNHEYRIFVPLANREIHLYDASGNRIKGWDASKSKSIINRQVQHLRVGSKDFIFAADSLGNIYLFDRRGTIRHPVSEKITYPATQEIFLKPGKNINASGLFYTDTLGNVVKLGFDGSRSSLGLLPHGAQWFYVADINADGKQEFVLQRGNELKVFDTMGSELYTYSLEGKKLNSPQLIELPGNKYAFGVHDLLQKKFYLTGLDGKIFPEDLLPAAASCRVSDINNDGSLEVIAAGEAGTIQVYTIDE